MAKLRAYKLAEELGIDRHEFVAKAAEVGVEVRSAMSGLDESEVETLREKLGQPTKSERQVVESRVKGSGGATVLRRRKRTQADPPPEPIGEEALPLDAEPDAPADELAPEAPELEEPVVADAEPVSEEPEAAGEAAEESPQPTAETPGVKTGSAGEDRAAPRSEPASPSDQDDRKGRKRKRVREIVNLQEQEKFARSVGVHG